MTRSLLVLFASAVLAGAVWLPLPDEQPEPTAGGPSALVSPSQVAGVTDNLEWRPLFAESRRPEPAAAGSIGAAPSSPGTPILRGVLRVGGTAIVMLEVPGDHRIHRGAVGEVAGDWEIVSENQGRVVVRHAVTRAEQRLLLPSL